MYDVIMFFSRTLHRYAHSRMSLTLLRIPIALFSRQYRSPYKQYISMLKKINTTGLKNPQTFPKTRCLWLTYSVKIPYLPVHDTDFYRTSLTFSTYTYSIVLNNTILLTGSYYTALNHSVYDTDTQCPELYNTERGCRHTLYITVQHSTHYSIL